MAPKVKITPEAAASEAAVPDVVPETAASEEAAAPVAVPEAAASEAAAPVGARVSAPSEDGAAPAAEPAPAPAARRTPAETATAARASVLGVFDALAPGHAHAALGGALGLLCALLVFWIGLWNTLVIALFVVAGVALGQLLDGDGTIIARLRRLVSGLATRDEA